MRAGEEDSLSDSASFPSTVSRDTFAINTITSNNHDELLVITVIQQLLGNSVLWAK